MNGTRNHHIKQNKSNSEDPGSHVFTHIWKLEREKEEKWVDGVFS